MATNNKLQTTDSDHGPTATSFKWHCFGLVWFVFVCLSLILAPLHHAHKPSIANIKQKASSPDGRHDMWSPTCNPEKKYVNFAFNSFAILAPYKFIYLLIYLLFLPIFADLTCSGRKPTYFLDAVIRSTSLSYIQSPPCDHCYCNLRSSVIWIQCIQLIILSLFF